MRDDIYHVPARAWTLAKLATQLGWEVRIEPSVTNCDVAFYRDDELVDIGWFTTGGRARLGHVSYDAADIRLRDVPAILRRARLWEVRHG